ncbi:MAG: signal peptidase I [Acidimicrobiales bacterium]
MPEATGDPSVSQRVAPRRRRRRVRGLVEWAIVLGVALAAALVMRSFVIQPFFIPSGSMEPTLHVGDKVLVNKLSYDLHPVHFGNVVVFRKPAGDFTPGITFLIKRVVGLPGETLRSGPAGEIYVDGHLTAQPWLSAQAKLSPGPPICDPADGFSHVDCTGDTLHLPPNEYYVMGDNRGDSEDSRYIGPISGSSIIGEAFAIVWPLSQIGSL